MRLFFITNSPALAAFAVENGATHIFVDLEINGKEARQGHLDTLISRHKISDIRSIKEKNLGKPIIARLNPLYAGSEKEITDAIDAGADILMLPMFKSAIEVELFCNLVAGRVEVLPLVETIGAMNDIENIVKISGVSAIHIGLNDLHLELGYKFMFQLLANGMLDDMARKLRLLKMPFGIGGIARVGEGLLPAEKLIYEHIRLGSDAAILSRTFHRNAASIEEIKLNMNFSEEIAKILHSVELAKRRDQSQIEMDRINTIEIINGIIENLENKE